MSGAELALLGVIIGGLLSPVSQGVGFLVRRHLERGDEARAERRRALVGLQEAIVDLTEAEEGRATMSQMGVHRGSRDRLELEQRIAATKRRTRVFAAQVGDDALWEMVNESEPQEGRAEGYVGTGGEPGDRYDRWNARIRELVVEKPDNKPTDGMLRRLFERTGGR